MGRPLTPLALLGSDESAFAAQATKSQEVRAQKFANASFDDNVKRNARQRGWTVIQLQEEHDLMITVPWQTVDILIGAAA